MTTLLALLTDAAPSKVRGVAVGLYRTFVDFGGFMGPIAFMIIYKNYSPVTPFHLGVALCVVNIVLIGTTKTRKAA